jgi:hypothetical protein
MHNRLIVPTFIALGVSLFGFFVRFSSPFGQTLTLAVTDMVIGLLLLDRVFRNRLIIVRSPVAYAVLCFAGVSLLSGIVNLWTDRTFDFGDFWIDYVRIIGLVAMVFLLPSVMRQIGHDRLAQSILWVMRLHAFLVFTDSLIALPLNWSADGVSWALGASDFTRPRGLFAEPSFFAVYMGLSLFYLLQVERNTRTRYIRLSDIILFSLALVASDSVSAVVVLGVFLMALAMRSGLKYRAKIAVGVTLSAVLFGLFAIAFQDTGPGRHWNNTVRRVSAVLPHQFEDGSSRQRLLGSSLTMLEVLSEAPLLGTGLGGTNLNRLMERYWQYDPYRLVALSLTTIPANVIAATGLLGFLTFVFIYGWTLKTPETRLIGLSLIAMAFLWGGAFEPILWWHVCLAVSLKAVSRSMVQHDLQARHSTLREVQMIGTA